MTLKHGDSLPDDSVDILGHRYAVTGRTFINRPVYETPEQRKARMAKGLPPPMLSHVVGRISDGR